MIRNQSGGKKGWAPTGAGEHGNCSCAVDRTQIFKSAPRVWTKMQRTDGACGTSVVCIDANQYSHDGARTHD